MLQIQTHSKIPPESKKRIKRQFNHSNKNILYRERKGDEEKNSNDDYKAEFFKIIERKKEDIYIYICREKEMGTEEFDENLRSGLENLQIEELRNSYFQLEREKKNNGVIFFFLLHRKE